MDPKIYVEGVLKNESRDIASILSRCTEENIRLLHAALGMATEAGEFVDALKKHLFYGKPLDRVNLGEELGDLLWYLFLALDVLHVSFEEVIQQNHNKLFTRYSKGFSSTEATNRDLEKERKVLEKK
jgi:NTP pyrophosphatase (non-canonical NTP hydrolase)